MRIATTTIQVQRDRFRTTTRTRPQHQIDSVSISPKNWKYRLWSHNTQSEDFEIFTLVASPSLKSPRLHETTILSILAESARSVSLHSGLHLFPNTSSAELFSQTASEGAAFIKSWTVASGVAYSWQGFTTRCPISTNLNCRSACVLVVLAAPNQSRVDTGWGQSFKTWKILFLKTQI